MASSRSWGYDQEGLAVNFSEQLRKIRYRTTIQMNFERGERFHHLALNATKEYQDSLISRAKDEGIQVRVIDHGYCTSLYLSVPDQHVVEITVDKPAAVKAADEIRAKARAELDRWLDGDHGNNNHFRATP